MGERRKTTRAQSSLPSSLVDRQREDGAKGRKNGWQENAPHHAGGKWTPKREKDSCCQGNHTGHGNEETMKDFGGRSGAKARVRE